MKALFGTYLQGDRVIWTVVIALSLLSVLAVYSSTGTLAYKYQGGNTWYYLFKHMGLMGFGLFLMYAVHLVPYSYFSRAGVLLIGLAIPMLLLTLVLGTNRNEATRWLTIPIINLSFQTSDLGKLALVTFLARQISKNQDTITDLKKGFLPMVLPVLAVCALIFPANFSTAALIFTGSMVLLFIGRAKVVHIIALLGTALLAGSFVFLLSYVLPMDKVLPRLETWKKRVETFAGRGDAQQVDDADANYQVEQAKIAIANGGITGVGPGNSTQRNFLPHPYSDFIYAIIIEEYGLISGLGVMFLYLVVLLRALLIAHRTESVFGSVLAFGCAFFLIFQALINMAVAVNLFPVTGQPLPLVSMGGTSLWFTSIALGMVLSVSRKSNEELKMQNDELKAERDAQDIPFSDDTDPVIT